MLTILFDFPWEDRRKLTCGPIGPAMRDPVEPQERLAHMHECSAYFQRLWNEPADAAPRSDLISR